VGYFGDIFLVYGDPKLNDPPYKQTYFQDWCKHVHLREEWEYDMYLGENYKAHHYGKEQWQNQSDVSQLLADSRTPAAEESELWGVNRFRKSHTCRMVLATFWRLMSGFLAGNVGMKIPGIQSKLKALADLPEQLLQMAGWAWCAEPRICST
jgi:hypothetical protein